MAGLRARLKEIGQQTSGDKQTLINRIVEVTGAPDMPPIEPGVQQLYARPRDFEKTLKRHKERFEAEQERSDQIAAAMEPSQERLAASRARTAHLPPPVSGPMRRPTRKAGHICDASCICSTHGCTCDVCLDKVTNEDTGRSVVRRRLAAMPSTSMEDVLRLTADFVHPGGGDDMEVLSSPYRQM